MIPSEPEWIEQVSRTLIESFELPLGVYVQRIGRPGAPQAPGQTFGFDLPFDAAEFHRRVTNPPDATEREQLYRVRPTVTTLTELRSQHSLRGVVAAVDAFGRDHGFEDLLMLAAGDAGSGRLLLASPWPARVGLGAPERDAWSRLGVHLAAAMRLRAATPIADGQADLAAELWQGLLRGAWRLTENFDAEGRRVLVARRSSAEQRAEFALSAREREVLSLAAQGLSNKAIAYHLDLSTSTAATHLKNALGKLGIGSRVELIQHASRLFDREEPTPSRADDEAVEVDFEVLEKALVVCARELARLARTDGDPQEDASRQVRVQQLRTTIKAFERLLSSIDVA